MQSSSPLSGVPSLENLHPGQLQVAQAVASASSQVVAKLPTGYGKTRAFCASFAVKRAQGAVDYLLYLVPRDAQVKQAAEDVPADLRDHFAIKTTATVVRDDPVVSLKRLHKGESIVFVTTIQSLATSPATFFAVQELTKHGRWFFAIDEYHNLPMTVKDREGIREGRYWETLRGFPRSFTLAMSATPRQDNGNDPFPPPDVRVRYRTAANAGLVKKLRLHHYEYRVDGILLNGDVITFTTTELAENEEEIESNVLKGQMRWSPKYISPLILIPAERMADYRARGIRTQMLVRAVSCSHADLVCSQIKALLPTLAVDWVGTGPSGRSDEENRAVLKRFCPRKDKRGRRHWDLDVLVQRGMASEGLDTIDVSEIVNVAPFNGTTQDLQLAGRGSRIMRDVNGRAIDVVTTINVDSATIIAGQQRYLGLGFMDIFDSDVVADDDDNPTQEDESDVRPDPNDNFLPEDPSVMLAEVSLINIKTEPGYNEMYQALRADPGAAHKSDAECEYLVESVLRRYIQERDRSLNASSINAQLRGQINNAVTKIVARLLRRLSATGVRIERTLQGDLFRRIRTRAKREFGEIDSLDEHELREQYKWLRELEQDISINERGGPSWLL